LHHCIMIVVDKWNFKVHYLSHNSNSIIAPPGKFLLNLPSLLSIFLVYTGTSAYPILTVVDSCCQFWIMCGCSISILFCCPSVSTRFVICQCFDVSSPAPLPRRKKYKTSFKCTTFWSTAIMCCLIISCWGWGG
jgi:hypothetical protein